MSTRPNLMIIFPANANLRKGFLCVLLVSLFASCLFKAEDKVAGTEVENEIGQVFEPGGGPAQGVAVRVVPISFNPQSQTAKTAANIYKLETNVKGQFSVAGIPAGQYNILASKADLVAFQDSVVINPGSTRLASDTLDVAGSITGVVGLQPNHNPASVTVQLLGTTFFTNVDAAGRFELKGLAEGVYSAKISTSLADYTPLYKSLAVKSGVRTEVADTLKPIYIGMPVVTGLHARYDTLSGAVSLSWNPATYANLLGYVVFRDTSLTRTLSSQPINKLRLLNTTYVDTLKWALKDVNEPPQFWEYRVAILGSSGKYGEAHEIASVKAVSPAIVRTFISLKAENTMQEMVTVGHTFQVIAHYGNILQSNKHLAWYLDSAKTPLREKTLASKSGDDTLQMQAPEDTGPMQLQVRVVDAAGQEWMAEIILQVVTWTRKADRPVLAYARAGKFAVDMPLVEAGGKIFVFGGRSSDPHPTLTAYDPAASKWSIKTEAPVLGNPVSMNGKIYLASDSALHVYDPSSDVWMPKSPLLIKREPLTSIPALEVGGKLLIYDGLIVSKQPGNPGVYISSSMEQYDPDKDAWTLLTAPNTISSAGLFSHQGRIFKTGFRTLYEYNFTKTIWETASSGLPPEEATPMVPFENTLNFLFNRRQVAAYLLDQDVVDYRANLPDMPNYTDFSFHVMDGKIYGLFQTGEDRITVAMYRRAENKWSLVPPIATVGNKFAAVVAGSKLYVVSYYDLRSPKREMLPSLVEYPPVP